MTVIILHYRIRRSMVAIQALSICRSVGFISFIVLQYRICRFKRPNAYIITCFLETTVFCQIVLNQSPICISDRNTVSTDIFHIIFFHYHIRGWIPIHRNSRVILFPLITPLRTYQLNSRTIYSLESTAGNPYIIIFAGYTCQNSILNISLHIKENTAVPFQINISIDVMNITIFNHNP